MVLIKNGTLLAIQNMTWNGDMGFQSAPNQSIVIEYVDLQYPAAFQANGYGGLDGPQRTMGVQVCSPSWYRARTSLTRWPIALRARPDVGRDVPERSHAAGVSAEGDLSSPPVAPWKDRDALSGAPGERKSSGTCLDRSARLIV